MDRLVEPELLDQLPPDHPDAVHNRRDLRLTNAVTGNHRWFARMLPGLLQPGERVLEIGAGTGELALRLQQRGVLVDGLDLWPRPRAWPSDCEWHVVDLREFDGYARYKVIVGNLIFHQFSDVELAELGKRIGAHARLILACEPARRRLSQALYRVIAPLFGANHVSLHDGRVSIAAGFRGSELPERLGLTPADWHLRCRTTVLGMYRMIAVRRG